MKKNSIQRGAANRSGHDPRTAALRVIDRTLTGSEPSQALLDKALKESSLVPSDKRLCTELVYGYLRNRIRLDWELARYLRRPEKLPEEMVLILGLAAYEIAHLRIPAHASVNWAVSRVRNRFGQGLAGVANGSLRAFAADAKDYGHNERYDAIQEQQARLSIRYAVPEWIVQLWLEAYGQDMALGYLTASSGQAVPTIRVNAVRENARALRARFLAESGGESVASFGVAFPNGMPYEAKKLEREGAVSFQSAAVQEILEDLGINEWKGPVWDACAGRGGKTAALMERGIPVAAATDIASFRIAGLPGELERLALPLPYIAEADAANPPSEGPFMQKFATILADVPCSGLGTLTRRPEIRFRRTQSDIAGLTATQDAILDAAARLLVPEGRIVYLTCTLNPAENQERVGAFLMRHPEFTLEKESRTPPDSPWREFFYGAVLAGP